MYQKWLGKLAHCALFQEMNANELEIMLECMRPKVENYEKNECVAVAGDHFFGVGALLTGELVISKDNAAGNRVIMAVVGPGEIFGEIAAFSGNRVWPATVVAQEASTVMFLPPEKIIGSCEKACVNHRLLITNMLRITSLRALLLNRKVEYLTMKSLRGKISAFLLEHHKKIDKLTFVMPMKRNELADFLNVSRPSLSREMCKMRDEGIIDFHRASVKITDIEKLRRMID